ncbi:unnamed protein product, partial [Hymenolepis diminuta]
CEVHNASQADWITCAITFWEVQRCNRSRRQQARPCLQDPPQPISNQDPCSLAWFCI